MPRASTVSEKVWAQAIHAVTVQKMSLRRAAQLYGVHHMSLHRRVRGRYVSPATARFADEFQLSRAETNEAVSVLREQFEHEQRVTADDVRYVVRTIACQGGQRDVPADFPQTRWITSFRRTHGFSTKTPSSTATSTTSSSTNTSASTSASNNTMNASEDGGYALRRAQLLHTNSSSSSNSSDSGVYGSNYAPADYDGVRSMNNSRMDDIDENDIDNANAAVASARFASHANNSDCGSSNGSIAELSHAAMSMRMRDGGLRSPMYHNSNHIQSYNHNSHHHHNSSSSMVAPHTHESRAQSHLRHQQLLASLARSDQRSPSDDTSESESESSGQCTPSTGTRDVRVATATATTFATVNGSLDGRTSANAAATESDDVQPLDQQRPAVSNETWERAMDAVEIHGMSLRNAAKAHGVHFAALHRRVKKRAMQQQLAPPLENYIPFEDEAGVVRVVHARADLGIPLSYSELVDLLQRTALKHVPAPLTRDFSRALVRRFQSRVEQSIRHLVCDWPLPRLDALGQFQVPPLARANSVGSITGSVASDGHSYRDYDASAMGDTVMATTGDDSTTARKVASFAQSSSSLYAREHDFPSEAHRMRLSVVASPSFLRPLYRVDPSSNSSNRSSSNMSPSSSTLQL